MRRPRMCGRGGVPAVPPHFAATRAGPRPHTPGNEGRACGRTGRGRSAAPLGRVFQRGGRSTRLYTNRRLSRLRTCLATCLLRTLDRTIAHRSSSRASSRSRGSQPSQVGFDRNSQRWSSAGYPFSGIGGRSSPASLRGMPAEPAPSRFRTANCRPRSRARAPRGSSWRPERRRSESCRDQSSSETKGRSSAPMRSMRSSRHAGLPRE